MSDLSAYRDKAANFGKQANQAENDKDYAGAFEFYMKALDIFQHMIKCKCPNSYHNNFYQWLTNSNQISYTYVDEKNPKLKEIYQRKAEEYFERAAYLKKQVLQPEKDVSVGGGSAAQQKPK
jgi:hypothetical protein